MRSFANLIVLAVVAVLTWPVFAQASPPPPPPPAAQSQAAAPPAAETTKPPADTPAAAPTKFEAADVHFTPWSRRVFYSGAYLIGDRYIIHQATMIHLVMTAYNLKEGGFVGGGPSWIGWDRYDIMAKVPPGTTLESGRAMLQNLLAERFKLVVHPGDVQVPAYLLTVANGKLNLKPSGATEEGSCNFHPTYPSGPGSTASFALQCRGVSMQTLANTLNSVESRDYVPYGTAVIDATGLKGRYDLDLNWTPKWFLGHVGSAGVSIYQALAQYGLNFELESTPRPGIVIDSVNREPTPNAPDLAKIMPPLPPPQFEVATIRPSKPDERGQLMVRGDQLNAQGVPLKILIDIAWDLDFRNDDTLVAPKWIDSDKIDVQAKVAASDIGSNTMGRSNTMNTDDILPLLRSLLIDRFEIKYHMEDRPIDAYTLEVADPRLASLKLKKADPTERTSCGSVPGKDEPDPELTNVMFNSVQTCWNIDMDGYASLLHHIAPDYFFYPVKDETGLKGAYDFTMSWSSADLLEREGPGPAAAPAAEGAPAASDPNGAVSFFDAIKKQLGLKVVKEKRPEPVLVIDHIDEQPTEN
jgi:uncharacterized protein (TIGR03435 family)